MTVISKKVQEMKKRFILVALIATSGLFSNDQEPTRNVVLYKCMPAIENVVIQAAVICASWSAKYTTYNFERLEYADIAVFKAYNQDCSIFVRYDKENNGCLVEFYARDDSFDYSSFISVIDTVFMYNEKI